MLENGYHDIPAGKIASVVTFLEMTSPPGTAAPARPDLDLKACKAPDIDWYRALYSRVGAEWLWYSRLEMPAAKLAAILADPGVDVFALTRDGADIGLLELDRRTPGEVEIAFFGLVAEEVGTGAGRWLMTEALKLAFAGNPARVWVHTCNLDHPAALGFYRRSGVRPYKYAVEVADDPRLTGTLPRDTAPAVPAIG
ncbi:MAG: GNAT family N-acetyltransferase [Hyphomicrobiales bacterium]